MSLSQRIEELNDARQEGIDMVLQALEQMISKTRSDVAVIVLEAALKDLKSIYQ